MHGMGITIDYHTPSDSVTLCSLLGMVHAWVGQIVTFFAYTPPSRPLGSSTPTARREGHQPDSGLPWATLGSPSGRVLAARA